MKHQALFSSKDKSKKIKMSSAAILHGAISVTENNSKNWDTPKIITAIVLKWNSFI